MLKQEKTMKIFSWNHLWSGLICAGGLTWCGIQTYSKTPALALAQFALAAFWLARGLWCVLTERGRSWAREQDRLNKLTEERQFGRYWPIVLWGGLAIPAPFLLLSLWRHEFLMVGLVLLGFASLYYLLVCVIFGKAKDEIRRAETITREEGRPLD
ncbi:hypothetical protein AALA82_02245 [Oscillospiraceae bacterium 50-16]